MKFKRVMALSVALVACDENELAVGRRTGTIGDVAIEGGTTADGGTSHPVADGGTADGATPNAGPYVLCDGSDAVRLSLVSAGGGPLPDSHLFTNPYGWSFLYVDGRCNFVSSTDVTGRGRRPAAATRH